MTWKALVFTTLWFVVKHIAGVKGKRRQTEPISLDFQITILRSFHMHMWIYFTDTTIWIHYSTIYFQINVNLYCTFRFCLSTTSIAFSSFVSPQNKHLQVYYLLICCWNAKVECSSNVCCTISEINSIHAKYQLIHSEEYKIDPAN